MTRLVGQQFSFEEALIQLGNEGELVAFVSGHAGGKGLAILKAQQEPERTRVAMHSVGRS